MSHPHWSNQTSQVSFTSWRWPSRDEILIFIPQSLGTAEASLQFPGSSNDGPEEDERGNAGAQSSGISDHSDHSGTFISGEKYAKFYVESETGNSSRALLFNETDKSLNDNYDRAPTHLPFKLTKNLEEWKALSDDDRTVDKRLLFSIYLLHLVFFCALPSLLSTKRSSINRNLKKIESNLFNSIFNSITDGEC